MNTKHFFDGYVGIKINSISEIMKYNALKGIFSIWSESEDTFEDYVEVTDDNGNVTEREPTENEKLERILEAFKNGTTLYATFWLDCGKVVPKANTTLQSNFRVGQEVFFMDENKICSKLIFRILLNKVVDYDASDDHTSITNGKTDDIIRMQHVKENLYWLGNTKSYISTCNRKCIEYYNFEVKKESEIFATKEELVKHLMEQ